MLTILTPTYNRAYILPKLYESLCRQTSKDFEWVVVDDGSTDHTKALVGQWIANKFKLKYIYQENGGKHRAVNRGVREAQYDFCFIVDSDDFLTDDAVELVHEWLVSIAGDQSFAGVSGLRGYINGGIIGKYPKGKRVLNYIDATNLQRKKLRLDGDKAEIYRTELLRRFPFPCFEGEKFISEAVVWDAIAANGYKIRWFNRIIYKCEYVHDGISMNIRNIILDNMQGYRHLTKLWIKCYGFPRRNAYIYDYVKMCKIKGISYHEAAKNIDVNKYRLYVSIIVGIGRNTRNKILRRGL